MAIQPVQPGAAPANTSALSALPQAFMEDFRAWRKVDDELALGPDDPEYQRACNAHEGGATRMLACGCAERGDIPTAALKLCIVFGELQNLSSWLSAGGWSDNLETVHRCMGGVQSAWEMLDGQDSPAIQATREYADYVGIPHKSDRVRWKRAGYKLPGEEA
jgi:hypothetical protein